MQIQENQAQMVTKFIEIGFSFLSFLHILGFRDYVFWHRIGFYWSIFANESGICLNISNNNKNLTTEKAFQVIVDHSDGSYTFVAGANARCILVRLHLANAVWQASPVSLRATVILDEIEQNTSENIFVWHGEKNAKTDNSATAEDCFKNVWRKNTNRQDQQKHRIDRENKF